LQAIELVATFQRGELPETLLAQVSVWSTPLTHSCWKLPWAATLDTAARLLNIAGANFILESENGEFLLLLLYF